MLRHLNWKHASGAVLFSASATLLAQQSVPTPGQVGDTLKPPAALEKPATAEIDQQPTEAASPSAAADGAVTITVSGFEWSGNTRYSNDELNAVVRAFVGKPLDILGIYEAADAVTAHYVDAGYTLASVKVPAQKVGSGVVKLEVIEGLVSSVAVQGQQRYREKFLAAHLADIQPEAVYEGTTLEQDLYVLNELPGLSSRAVLKPGAQFGTSDIVVEVTEDPFEFQTTVDNYGRESTGEFRASINGAVNNPLTLADQFSYMLLVSDKALLKYAFAEYSVPINTMGSRLALSYGHADFEVDEDVFDGIEGKNSQIRMKLGHPVLRGRQSRIDAYTAVSHTDADSDLFGTTLPRETDLLLLEVGGSVVHRWPNFSQSQLNLELSSNFDQATSEALNINGSDDDQRFRIQMGLLHQQPLPQKLQALIQLSGAWSPDPLVDTQQFSVGGPGSVRAYPPSDIRGDKGYFTSLTLRRPFIIQQVTTFVSVFADHGRIMRVDADPGVSEEESLTSVGLGTELRWRQWSFKLDGAVPTDNHQASDGQDDYRFFGSLSVRF